MSFSISRPALSYRNFVAPRPYQPYRPYAPVQPQAAIGGGFSASYSAPAFSSGAPFVASPAQYYGGFAAPARSVVQDMFQNPSDVQNIMNDPSLTVEDKVALTLMAIMNGMDKEIEGQTNNLNALQAQQGAGGAGGAGGANKSVDMESMKLQRLVTKRSQMFDTLRQVIDRYNQTAKGVIDSIAR